MAWVPLEISIQQFDFVSFASSGGVVSWQSSIATQDAGSPPTGGPEARWALQFDPDGGARAPLRLRITSIAYESAVSGDPPFPFSWGQGIVGDITIVIGTQENTAPDPTSQWLPSLFEIELDFADGEPMFLAYYLPAELPPATSSFLIEAWEDGPEEVNYNCTCDDENNNETLGELRNKMMHLLGWGATAANPPPGVAQMLTYWLQDAQAMLYRRFTQLRTERFFSWPLVQGVRMYDLPDNQETCTKRLDPRKLTWVGTERDGVWLPLISSIPPELYSYQTMGRPVRYEIRQCIEVWPTPDATNGNLIIKGHFGLERFTEDADKTTIDSLPVFQVALANAKAHYRQPDANNYIQQMEALIRDLTAGLHGTRRYIPGRRADEDCVYVEPRPTVPFPTS